MSQHNYTLLLGLLLLLLLFLLFINTYISYVHFHKCILHTTVFQIIGYMPTGLGILQIARVAYTRTKQTNNEIN